MGFGAPKTPKPKEPVPVPQAADDDPYMIDVQRRRRDEAEDREGAAASLLTTASPANAGTRKKKLIGAQIAGPGGVAKLA